MSSQQLGSSRRRKLSLDTRSRRRVFGFHVETLRAQLIRARRWSAYYRDMFSVWILTIVSVAVTVLAVLCGRGRIPRNPWVGIRIPAFFTDDEAWRTGHHAAVLPMIVATIVSAVIATALPQLDTTTATLITAGVIIAGLIAGAIRGSRAISTSDND